MNVDLSQYSFDTIALNVVVAWLIQKVKLSKWSVFNWIGEGTPKVTMMISVMMAALTSAGMATEWKDVGATHTLVISGISWQSLLLFLWYTVKNVAFQHTAYKVAFKPPEAPPKPLAEVS